MRVLFLLMAAASALGSVAASSGTSLDPLFSVLTADFHQSAGTSISHSKPLNLLFAQNADHGGHSDASLTVFGRSQAKILGERWFRAATALHGQVRDGVDCNSVVQGFFGRFDAVHVSAEISALQTLVERLFVDPHSWLFILVSGIMISKGTQGFALESFAHKLAQTTSCNLQTADTAIVTAFKQIDFLVVPRLNRASVATKSAETISLSLRDRVTTTDRDLLLRIVTQAIDTNPKNFVLQLHAPGRTDTGYDFHTDADKLTTLDPVLQIVPRVFDYLRSLNETALHRILVLAHGELLKVLAATQVALSLRDTSIQALQSANKVALTPDQIEISDLAALALRMEWAAQWASDLGVARAGKSCATADLKELLSLRSSVDMYAITGVLFGVASAEQRPTMLKLPTRTTAVHGGIVPMDRDPVLCGR